MSAVAEIDQVSIQKAAGFNLVSVGEWLKMPLSERVDLLCANKVQFLAGGSVVPTKEALKSLQ